MSFPQQSAPHDFKKLSDYEVMLLTSDAHRDYNEQLIIFEEAALVFWGTAIPPTIGALVPSYRFLVVHPCRFWPTGIHDEKPIRRE